MQQVTHLLEKLREQNLKLVTAESCTGGLIATSITEVAGSSDVFERGFITYSNQSKIELLGVSPETLEELGAVSAQTATEMALGAIKNSSANVAISVTGIAGPTGGSAEKPVGLVYIGIYHQNKVRVYKHNFSGSRCDVRKESAERAINYLLGLL